MHRDKLQPAVLSLIMSVPCLKDQHVVNSVQVSEYGFLCTSLWVMSKLVLIGIDVDLLTVMPILSGQVFCSHSNRTPMGLNHQQRKWPDLFDRCLLAYQHISSRFSMVWLCLLMSAVSQEVDVAALRSTEHQKGRRVQHELWCNKN